MKTSKKISTENYRRFGVEIEINSFDMRSKCLGTLPDGIYYISSLVKNTIKNKVTVHEWGNDHYNDVWILKPDSSCGIEICSPVMKGWRGLSEVCRVIDALHEDESVQADNRCSFHIHVDVSDLTEVEICSIISWWIKCEPIFMDLVPYDRKINQYCQYLGLHDKISTDLMSYEDFLQIIGTSKYYSMNAYHLAKEKRRTLEFRIMDSSCCLNSWSAKNWVRLILHFIETSIKTGIPKKYKKGNPLSGLCWIDPIDFFKFLNWSSKCDLTDGMKQVRRWLLDRAYSKGRNHNLLGIASDNSRRFSINEFDKLIEELFYNKEDIFLYTKEDVYGNKYRI
ncbi:MAG: hypothetical protein EKK64_10445 [Neisseriaceae bacterium]|nr:MAG: hypothetical protein EKK64_10445 [Neisseriaceae bacterium]